ncbi:MAG: hypothetical protein WDZ84_04975 [Rhodovibrionaceae bacterium]
MERDDLELELLDVCEVLAVTPQALSLWRQKGNAPRYETIPSSGNRPPQKRYRYRLGPVLEFMANRGATKREIEVARRKIITRHRLRLARAADVARGHAICAIRKARRVREAAALAGHKPSIRIFESGDF